MKRSYSSYYLFDYREGIYDKEAFADALGCSQQHKATRDEEHAKSFRRKRPLPKEAGSAVEAFKQIRSYLQDKLGLSLNPLNHPATDEAIARLETALGEPLPIELVELYRYCDGESFVGDEDLTPALFYEYLVSSKEAADCVALTATEPMRLSVQEGYFPPTVPDGCIKNVYLHSKWLPVAHDCNGNIIGIDLDPDTKGTKGQVIVYGRDEDRKFVVAQSLSEFFALFLEMLVDEESIQDIPHPHPLFFKTLYEEVPQLEGDTQTKTLDACKHVKEAKKHPLLFRIALTISIVLVVVVCGMLFWHLIRMLDQSTHLPPKQEKPSIYKPEEPFTLPDSLKPYFEEGGA
ncbi:MAG: SMI1/KNR4 family protein [Coriobacteriales bacterium]|jgi:cell wall assembly regulator SMI1|nr:SMI1/KNR4 family protein [Coriobacteriales bacterium]